MSQRRLVERPDHEAVRAPRSEPQPSLSATAARLLALQRSAGNVAVARFIAAGSQRVAREGDDDGYMTGAATPDVDTSSDESEMSEDETGLNPVDRLATAVSARLQDTGRAFETLPPPPVVESYEVSDDSTDGGTGALRDDVEATGYEARRGGAPVAYTAHRVGGGAQHEEDVTEISEDEPDAGPVPVAPPSAADSSSEESLSEDVLAVPYTAEPSQDELEAGPPAPSYIPAPPPTAKKKGRARRALKAVAKPFKAVGRGLKKLGKRVKRGKKSKVTAAELTATADAPPVEEPTPAANYAAPLPYTAALELEGGGGVEAENDETSISEDLPAAPPPLKYLNLAKMGDYKKESADSSAFLNDKLLANDQLSGDMIRHQVVPPGTTDAAIMSNPELVKFGLKTVWGWSDKDIATYYDFGKNKAKASKVTYIRSEADLKKFVVHAGSTMTYGDPPQVFDTAGMVSKASGPGFAIFVMDENGNIFAGQHRVGLFHHSSFTAGLPVAAAGEIKVTGGALEVMTSKSGHYTPSAEQTWQAVQKMAALGVSFATAEIRVWREDKTDYYRGMDFLRRGPQALVVKTEGRWK